MKKKNMRKKRRKKDEGRKEEGRRKSRRAAQRSTKGRSPHPTPPHPTPHPPSSRTYGALAVEKHRLSLYPNHYQPTQRAPARQFTQLAFLSNHCYPALILCLTSGS